MELYVPLCKFNQTAASDQVIRSIAGHVNQKMLEHYSHARLEAKRRALEALATVRPQGQNFGVSEGVTSHGTSQKQPQRECQRRKSLKKLAGTTGLEPATSCVTGMRSNQLNYVPLGRRQPLRSAQ